MHPLGVNKVQKCTFLKEYHHNDRFYTFFSPRVSGVQETTYFYFIQYVIHNFHTHVFKFHVFHLKRKMPLLVDFDAVFMLFGKGSGVWPSMVPHTRNLSSAFNPSKCTLTAVNTHPEQWAAMLRCPGSSWGIGALLKGLTSCRGIEGGESTCYSLPPPTIPAGPGNRTCNL